MNEFHSSFFTCSPSVNKILLNLYMVSSVCDHELDIIFLKDFLEAAFSAFLCMITLYCINLLFIASRLKFHWNLRIIHQMGESVKVYLVLHLQNMACMMTLMVSEQNLCSQTNYQDEDHG